MQKTLITFVLLSLGMTGCFGGDPMLHSSFNLTRQDLREIVAEQPEPIREKILAEPERFLELADFMLNQPEELFYLADKKNALRRDQAPRELVRPFDYGISVTRKEREVSSLIIDSLKAMTEEARREGLDILFASGYRSYDYQEMLYNRYVKQMGQEEADRVSARPGTSQHQLGTAVDFGSISDEYALTDEGRWLAEKAGDFGFSLSYPQGYEDLTGYKWECWHYRYITIEGMAMQREFFLDIQQYLMEFWNSRSGSLKSARR